MGRIFAILVGMDSMDRLLTELQQTGRCTLFSVPTLNELVYLCDTLGFSLHEMLVSPRGGNVTLLVKGFHGN